MSVTAAGGFRAAGVAAGLKLSGGRDVALVVNDGPSDVAAAVFTRNRVQAAPVLWSRQAIADGRLRAVVLNSGGANACTGPAGFADTHPTAECVATALDIGAGDVAVCSTGLIGERLPMDALLAGVDSGGRRLWTEPVVQTLRTPFARRTRSPNRRCRYTPTGGRSAGWRKARACSPRLSRPCSERDHDRRRRQRGPAGRGATATRCAGRSSGSTPTAACPRTTPCILLASGASGRPAQSTDLGADGRGRLRGPGRPTASTMRRAPRSMSPSWLAARPRRTTRSRSVEPSRETTCSNARCSATTRTGAGSWRQSARLRRRSSQTGSMWHQRCRGVSGGRGGGAAGSGRSHRARSDHRGRPARRCREQHHPYERSLVRLRPKRTRRIRREPGPRRRSGEGEHARRRPAVARPDFTARSLSSSTAVTQ